MSWRSSNECCFDYRGEDISSEMENSKQHFCNGKNCCLLPCKRSGKVTPNPATATTARFAWLPNSASWGSAKKKLTINYLSGTRETVSTLPAEELRNVARSAYQHRFPYRYSCRDEILRRFCPLPNYESCRKFVAEHAQPRAE